ncbi:type II secretion system protein GspC [Geopsychrobacter electrodiphilus]|uniref:type II secretion system protein GspC n=1 Tax=Geopsychrobacter electrodiphilus TaxID=225196 RepID=UPI000368771A|nr:type II secretion system protein GspC [Geopsychrobacter electrodiphilus]
MLITLLQRHYLWIFATLSGLMGLTVGHLGATVIGILAGPGQTSALIQTLPPIEAKALPSLADYQTILSRDIFNSAAQNQTLTPTTKTAQTTTSPAKTASKWSLVGTISGGPSPLATLTSGRETDTYHLNQELPDGGKLADITRNRVEIRYPDGQSVILELETDKQGSPVHAGSPVRAASPATTPAQRSGTDLGIESIGENNWIIPAQVAEDSRSNIGELLKQAQAIPYLEGGKTTGFQMNMIQRGSFIEQLGLKKGDILREINGVELDSPEKALQIFGQLRQAKQISIGLERGGKAMTFAYEIR